MSISHTGGGSKSKSKTDQVERVTGKPLRPLTGHEAQIKKIRALKANIEKGLTALDVYPNTATEQERLRVLLREGLWHLVGQDFDGCIEALERTKADLQESTKQAKLAFERAAAQREKNFKDSVKSAKTKKKVEEKQQDLRSALQDFDADPMSAKLLLTFPELARLRQSAGKTLTDANVLGSREDWDGALKRIKEGSSDVAAFSKFVGSWEDHTVGDKDLRKEVAAARKLLETHAATLHSDVLTASSEQIVDAMLRYRQDRDQNVKDAKSNAQKTLTSIQQEIANQAKLAQERALNLGRRLDVATNDLRVLEQIALASEVGAALILKGSAATLLGRCDFDACSEKLDALHTEITRIKSPLVTSHQEWLVAGGTLKALAGRISVLSQAKWDKGVRFPHDPADLFAQEEAVRPGDGNVLVSLTTAQGVARVAELLRQIEEDEAHLGEWNKLDGARQVADKRVNGVAEAVQGALDHLADALKQKGAAPAELGGLKARLADVIADWKTLTGTETVELDEGPTIALLEAITREAQDVLGDPEALGRMASSELGVAAIARGERALVDLDAVLDRLAVYPHPRVDDLRKRREDAEQRYRDAVQDHRASVTPPGGAEADSEAVAETARAVEASVETLEKLTQELTKTQVQMGTDVAIRTQNVKNKVVEIRNGALAELTKKASAVAWSISIRDARAEATKELPRLRLLADKAYATAETHVTDILASAERLAELLERKVTAWLEAVDGKAPPPHTDDNVVDRLKAFRQHLTPHLAKGKQFRPSKIVQIQNALDDIEARRASEEPSRLLTELSNLLNQDLFQLTIDIQKDADHRVKFKAQIKTLQKEQGELATELSGYPRFRTSIEASLRSADAMCDQENRWVDIGTTLQSVQRQLEEIRGWKLDPNVQLGDKLDQQEQGLRKEELAKETRKAAFEERMASFEKNLFKLLVRKEAKEQVEALIRTSKENAKQGFMDGAERNLDLAIERTQFLRQFPDGPPSVTSLKQLDGVKRAWSSAVSNFGQAIEGFRLRFDKEPEPARTALLQELVALERLFDPNAFEVPVRVITAKGSDAAARLGAREAALKSIRGYRERIVKDERFRLLSQHPFDGVPTFGNSTLTTPLVDLERVLLMAVPTT